MRFGARLLVSVLSMVAGRAQDLTPKFIQRGFFETRTALYPQTGSNDSAYATSETLFRYDARYRVQPWLSLNAGLDARADSHDQFDRTLHFDWQDRSLERPAISARQFNATVRTGKLTATLGRQFIRWGKADILNPTDRFAPKDFLTVVDVDFLAVTAARATYDTGANSFDFIWQPRFTPSRTPLLNQRWTVLPPILAGVPIRDLGAQFPGRSSFGARWNHTSSALEYSFSFYDGFNYLPQFQAQFSPVQPQLDLRRYYPSLRLYGADLAVPCKRFTLKAEAAYYTSRDRNQDEYLIYVLQAERQIKELLLVGGYAGEVVTASSGGLQFSPERGFARAFLGRGQYTIDANRTLSVDTAVRQNGRGSLLRAEYSQTFGQHWRATTGFAWLRGDSADFLGQYRRNSHGILALRYSF